MNALAQGLSTGSIIEVTLYKTVAADFWGVTITPVEKEKGG